VIESIGRRLRVAFSGSSTPTEVVPEPLTPALPPEVEFVAYADDCLLSGHVRLAADRLSDMLNAHDEYLLVDVLVERLDDSPAIEVKEVLVERDELLLVHATGPRGDQGRRRRTRVHPVAMQMGPYHVRGYVHTVPGGDPLTSIRRRKAMVPLTEAWIEYTAGGTRQRRRVAALVVNREQIDWIVNAADEEIEYPDLPVAPSGPLLKDFTGELFSDRS
jgi:hypothetical protein